MKKFTFMTLALLLSVVAFAQKGELRRAVPFQKFQTIQVQGVTRAATAASRQAPRRSLGLVTPPANVEAVTYYTVDGTLAVYGSSGWQNYTSNRPSIKVIVDGADIYIAGLAYWAESAWIKGTIEGTTATFPAAQQVDDDADYPEWMHGSDDGETISDIVFTFDQEAGTLVSESQYIFEAASETEASLYAYWIKPSFSAEEPAGPELVVLPQGAETVDYVLTYTANDGSEGSAPAKVAVVGDEVYVQGISYYLPDAWVKGVKDGNTVTFAGNQYVGTYGSYGESYAFYNGDTEFTYDPETESYSADGQVFGVLGGRYYDGNYTNPVLKKVVEQAAMPAAPAIEGLTNHPSYGWYVAFNIPTVDVDGNGLLTSKLSYQFYVDVEKEVSPLTFTPATHQELTESMTVIPYGFTENYDFYDTYIFLNDLYSADWNKIGIKSIYTGGDEVNETEIQWFTIKKYALELALDDLTAEIAAAEELLADPLYTVGIDEFTAAIDAAKAVLADENATIEEVNAAIEALKEAEEAFKEANADSSLVVAQWVAKAQEYDDGEEVESFTIDDEISATADKGGNTSNAPKYYKTGTALRVYAKNTLTITASENVEKIKKIVFTTPSTSSQNGSKLVADTGELTVDGTTTTWSGEATEVVFTQDPEGTSGHVRIQAIDVYYTMPTPEEPEDQLVELPAGVEAEAWTLEGTYRTNQGASEEQIATEVAFAGSDIYVKGLAYYFPEAWIKGTIDEDGIATFPTGQFVGEDEYGTEYLLGYNYEDEDNEEIVDIQFAYDAEAQTLTQITDYILENGDSKTELSFYGYWYDVLLYAGEPIVLDPVEAPEGLETETYLFKALSHEYEEDEETGEQTDNIEEYTYQTQVGFDGQDVYFKGFSENTAELWAKGTLSEDGKTVTIPVNQYMGSYDVGGLGWFVYDYFFTAVDDEDNLVDVVLNYDAETNTFTTDQIVALNGSKNSLYYYQLFTDVTITKMEEFAAMPADPEVVGFNGTGSYPSVQLNVPATDVEGNDLLTSKLFYTIWVDIDGQEQQLEFTTDLYSRDFDEDVVEIPYAHDGYDVYTAGSRVYLNQDVNTTWKKIGVQSIYYGGGEVNKTDIAWYDLTEYWISTGIASVSANTENARFFDLQGRAADKAQKGLLIMKTADGKTIKVVRK